MYSLKFWFFVALGAVVVFGWKIWSDASGHAYGGSRRPGTGSPVQSPDHELFDDSAGGPTDNQQTPTASGTTDSTVQDTDWFLIARAPDREVAYDVMEQLSENGVDAGIREQPAHGSYSGVENPADVEVPIVVDKSQIEGALTVLKNSGFLDDLTMTSE